MHKRYFILILIVLQLMTSHQVIADVNTQSRVAGGYYIPTSDPEVSIISLGYSVASYDTINSSNGIYEITSEKVYTPMFIRVKISEFTELSFGNVQTPLNNTYDLGSSTTMGQTFVIVNDVITVVSTREISEAIPVVLSQGDNLVSVLHVNYNGQLRSYSDSIVVRIFKPNEETTPYLTEEIPYDTNIDELAAVGSLISENVIVPVLSGSSNERHEVLYPTANISVYSKGEEISNLITLDVDQIGDMVIKGTVNTTGFTGLQILGEWPATAGLIYVVDAVGIHLLSEVSSITLREGTNFLGALALSPYGTWHQDLTCYDQSPNFCASVLDFDSSQAYRPGLVNASGEIERLFDSSFDALAQVDGITVTVVFGSNESTVTNQAVFDLVTSVTMIAMARALIKRRKNQ